MTQEVLRHSSGEGFTGFLSKAGKRSDFRLSFGETKDQGEFGDEVFTIDFQGAITSQTSSAFIEALQHAAEHDPEKEIQIKINSRGGELQSCLNIAKEMAHTPNPISTFGESQVMSGATLILAAGDMDKRFIWEDTEIMVHQSQITIEKWRGSTPQLIRQTKEFMRKNREFLRELAEQTGQPIQTILALTKEDRYLPPREAVNLGFADHIISRVRRDSRARK